MRQAVRDMQLLHEAIGVRPIDDPVAVGALAAAVADVEPIDPEAESDSEVAWICAAL